MSDRQKILWSGVSGTYIYYVYRLPHSFPEGQEGNYIITKVVNGAWQPIYIGQGDLGKRITENHHQWDCIVDKEATHVHVHLGENESDRKAEEGDLLNNFPQAYQPDGCNEKQFNLNDLTAL